jgi:hypothetical protein
MLASHCIVSTTLALAAMSAVAQSTSIPITNELTEAHTAIGLQYFIVGRIASTCQKPLGKPESFARDTLDAWARANQPYVNALTKYQAALHVHIEAKKGREGLSAELTRYREIVQRQGTALVAQAFGGRDPGTACPQFERLISEGRFNIGPAFPLYAEVSKLLQAVSE